MRYRPDACHAYTFTFQIRRSLELWFGHDALQSLVNHARHHHRIAAAQSRRDQDIARGAHHLDIFSQQRADAGGAALPGDNDFGIDAVLAEKSFFLGHPCGTVQSAHGAKPHANLVLGHRSLRLANSTEERNQTSDSDALKHLISLLFTPDPLLFIQLRQRLFEITRVDIFRRLGQRFFQDTLLSGDFDQRAHTFYVKIGVPVPDAAFPIVVGTVSAVLDTDRHLF